MSALVRQQTRHFGFRPPCSQVRVTLLSLAQGSSDPLSAQAQQGCEKLRLALQRDWPNREIENADCEGMICVNGEAGSGKASLLSMITKDCPLAASLICCIQF